MTIPVRLAHPGMNEPASTPPAGDEMCALERAAARG